MAKTPEFNSGTHLFTCHSARDGASWTSPVEVHLAQTYDRDQPLDLAFLAASGRAQGRILAVATPTYPQIKMLAEGIDAFLRRACPACCAAGSLHIPSTAVTQGHTCGLPNANGR
jgi:hypothetical protein